MNHSWTDISFAEVHQVAPTACYEKIDPDFGRVMCSDSNLVGSECQYMCNDGYELEGQTDVTTCREYTYTRYAHYIDVI